jgi:hypothetical protein
MWISHLCPGYRQVCCILIISYLFTGYPLDDLYLGPDDDIEDDSVLSGSPDGSGAIPGRFIDTLGSSITMHAH